jgi:hypothetical protein
VRATSVAADLSAGNLEVIASGGDELANVAVVTTSSETCLAWSQEETSGNSVQLTCYAQGDAANAPAAVEVSDANTRTTNAVIPAATAVNDEIVLMWWDNDDGSNSTAQLEARRYDTALNPLASDSLAASREAGGVSEPIAIAATATSAVAIALDYDQTSFARALAAIPFDFATNAFGTATRVYESGSPRSPAAIATDADDDGTPESVLVAFVADGDLLAGTFPFANPVNIASPTTLQTGSSPAAPALAASEYRIGAHWLRVGGTTATRFAPLSRNATGICAP